MRRRILLTLLASTSIVLFAFLVPLMVIVGDLAVDRAQRQVVLEIQPLVSRIPVVDESDLPSLVSSFTATAGRPATLVLPDDSIVGANRSPDAAVQLARERGAFFAEVPGGRDLLVPIYTDDGEAVLSVFVSDAELTEAVPRARITLAALGALLLAVSVGLGLVLARAFLRPIGALSVTAGRLGAGDLTARVPSSAIPELDSAGRALNRMAERVAELLNLEREEVADLAHRLRTPVAALRLDAESLPASDVGDRLRADVDHVERVVDEVIREARRPLRDDAPARVDLGAVAAERASFWSVLAEDQQRPMALDVPTRAVPIACDPRDLGDALDALIGNVFSHTDEGVGFRVACGIGPGPIAWVEVSDDGLGWPRSDVLERGASDSGSTGLGLDIARRVAERAGGSIELSSGLASGARVRLTFRQSTTA